MISNDTQEFAESNLKPKFLMAPNYFLIKYESIEIFKIKKHCLIVIDIKWYFETSFDDNQKDFASTLSLMMFATHQFT